MNLNLFRNTKNEIILKTNICFLGLFLFCNASVFAQKKQITLDDIFVKSTFSQKSVNQFNWMKKGPFYSELKENKILKNAIQGALEPQILLNGSTYNLKIDKYSFVPNESKIIIATDFEPIFRHSGISNYFVFDIATQKMNPVSANGKQGSILLNPQGNKIAFARANNLFVKDIEQNMEIQITFDGKTNEIINGMTDWVYEEEFGFTQAFEWNTDGTKLAFIKFDERQVPQYNMQTWGELYPKDYLYKYPKAGEKNAIVDVFVYDMTTQKTIKIDTGTETDKYIPRIKWTQDANLLSIAHLNRKQNIYQLFHANTITGQVKTILKETEKAYYDFEINKAIYYLSDGKSFITSSETSGYKHLYRYNMDGTFINQLTTGNWEVDEVLGIDEVKKKIYYTSTEVSALERHFYTLQYEALAIAKKSKTKFVPITTKNTDLQGLNDVSLSADFESYVLTNQSLNSPKKVFLKNTKDNSTIKILEENTTLNAKIEQYNWSKPAMATFKAADGTPLNATILKPVAFDSTKKYPVLMIVYGGPGKQMVMNSYGGDMNGIWHQILANTKGYIIVTIDNRGTEGRGASFRKSTYAQLGKIEVQDQIAAAKQIQKWGYVDASRIGIWGWSYGGFMASNCIMQGADVFKAAIAVAPVTSWRFYDTIYTERYNGLPQENPTGYDDNSPISHVKKLKGNFLLIHGTADDNVHFQNAIELQTELIKAGKQFDSFYYPGKNHGIYGGNTRQHLYTLMTNWLEKNL